jgi:hypothetical protein
MVVDVDHNVRVRVHGWPAHVSKGCCMGVGRIDTVTYSDERSMPMSPSMMCVCVITRAEIER